MTGRNRIPLHTNLDGEMVSHFSMHEFENPEGWVMIHPIALEGLERVRKRLNELHGGGIIIIIKSATRTEAQNEALADVYGWVDEGGKVSRNSRHLARYGGIAVDIIALNEAENERVLQDEVGAACREQFDWVKDDYPDGHVHGDQRDGGRKLK